MSERFTRTIERGMTGLVAAGLAVSLLAAGSATAQVDTPTEPLTPAQQQLFPAQRAGGVSLGDATAMALNRYPGRVVRAEPVREGDRVVYEIRILDAEGRVRNVRIDAQTGSFL
jgi:uncharacterized membrane protein YkoI